MTHCQVKGTGRGTVWHIARWKALVVVPYDTLPGERHWSWYRMTHYHMKGTGHGTIVTHFQVKGTGRGTVWHIAKWKALVVVPYNTLPGEMHWSRYRMIHFQVKCTGRCTPYDILPGDGHWSWYRMTHSQVKCTGRGTVWHIARWNALVVVPYDTFPGEMHWSWYVWHISKWNALVVVHRMTYCQVKGTCRGTVWHIDRLH
jgi:hypothetical protein